MKNVKRPLVSVIMPVYNAAEFLEEAIESIVNQTYKNWELVIIDDASTDKSFKIIQKFKKDYPRKIKVRRLRKNLGKGGDSAANVGFRMIRGELVARMDADDIALPQRLERQVGYMLNNREVFMLGGQAKVIDGQGRLIGRKRVPLSNGKIYDDFFMFHPMIHPTVMIRRSGIKRQELYRIRYSANNDLLTFFEFLRTKKLANLDEDLIMYRIHEGNDSLKDVKGNFIKTLKIRIKAVRDFDYKPSIKAVSVTFCQLIVVFLVPKRLALKIYMLAKGIYSPGREIGRMLDWNQGNKLTAQI